MRRKGRSRKDQLGPQEIDLKPMMNLFVVLIPFLLACAQFAKIVLVEIKLPERSENQVKVKKEQEEGLNLSIIITDKGVTMGARGGFLPTIHYREFHEYESRTDHTNFTVEYDPDKPDVPVFSPTDGKKMTMFERMKIRMIVCEREHKDDKGTIVESYHNDQGEALTTATGKIVKEIAVGDTVFSIPYRQSEIVMNVQKYRKQRLNVYDRMAVDLLHVKARYQGQGMPDEKNIIIAAEDQIAYDKIIQTIDICKITGFPNVSVAKMKG